MPNRIPVIGKISHANSTTTTAGKVLFKNYLKM
jgi:hypothetical protein